jgi:transcriptional regulator GlxA family with amidase domain
MSLAIPGAIVGPENGTMEKSRGQHEMRKAGFRLGVYVFKDAEVIDYAAPIGVLSVARRFDPEIDVFLVAETLRPVQTQAGITVLPNYGFTDRPAMDAFLIPGGFGTRQEMHNRNLHDFIQGLPDACLLTSVCTGSWIYACMGLLDGLPATNRKEPDRLEASHLGKTPIARLAELAPACRISHARVVDAGRIVTAGGISSGMELGFHLLRRAGYDAAFIQGVARVMEYQRAYAIYEHDIEYANPPLGSPKLISA